MDLGLEGKVALVTGANRGIGRATALSLAGEGCAVAVCSRDGKTLADTARRIRSRGVAAAAVPADVLEPRDADRFVREAADALGRVDILVNNVGGGFGGGFFDLKMEDLSRTFDYNVSQGIRLSQLVVPHMRLQGGGSIVFVSSISGWVPQLCGTLQYGASKAAEIFMVEPLALQLARDNIRVNVVSPGSILFEGGGWDKFRKDEPAEFADYEKNGFPRHRLGRPEEVADVITFLVSGKAGWVNGAHIRVDGLEQPVPARPLWQ